jgi:hypothetical protein
MTKGLTILFLKHLLAYNYKGIYCDMGHRSTLKSVDITLHLLAISRIFAGKTKWLYINHKFSILEHYMSGIISQS